MDYDSIAQVLVLRVSWRTMQARAFGEDLGKSFKRSVVEC